MQIVKNKKAYFDYFILDKYEAGISLLGSEVKSIRNGEVSIAESFISIEKNVQIKQMFINQYTHSNTFKTVDPTRPRQLLLNKKEIERIKKKTQEKSITIVPLEIYENKQGKIKLLIAVVKGKKLYDKRHELKEKTINLKKGEYNE